MSTSTDPGVELFQANMIEKLDDMENNLKYRHLK